MTRRVVDTVGLLRQVDGRRADLAHLKDRTSQVGAADRLAELDLLAALIERYAQDHGYSDPTEVSRPGVLLVGAGVRGGVTVPADLETLDMSLLSDRDLAVFGGLLRWVGDRVDDERLRRGSARQLGACSTHFLLGALPEELDEEARSA